MATEPILNDDDRACWDAWMRAAREHARTQAFARKVERARVAVIEALSQPDARHPGASASSGKDSTVMLHLIVALAGGTHVAAVTQQDDLDYPGEHEYAAARAARLGVRQVLLTPAVSAAGWLAAAAARGEIASYDDVHSRLAGLSKACFYGLMEADNATRGLVFMGLRREESNNRDRVAAWAIAEAYRRRERGEAGPVSGLTRWHKGAAQWRCLPVAEFRGIDVYAYAARYDLELLPVYRCVGLMHRDDPSRIRVAWWIPGGHAADGQVAWLRRYYPSLYRQLCAWMPDASLLA